MLKQFKPVSLILIQELWHFPQVCMQTLRQKKEK